MTADQAENKACLTHEGRESPSSAKEILDQSDFEEKVSSLRDSIDSLNEEVSSHSEKERWSAERKLYYMEAIDKLQKEVKDIEHEWHKLSETLNKQMARLDTLLTSFPDAVDVSTLKLLSIRVSQIEQLLSEHINEERGKENTRSSRMQLTISAVMLFVTVVLWGFWIFLQFKLG
jgi:seryl-tRNA synthetase